MYRGQIVWSVSGLETSLYEMLLVATVYFLLNGLKSIGSGSNMLMCHGFDTKNQRNRGYRSMIFAGIFMAIAGMTRPEAWVLMALFSLLICVHHPFNASEKRALLWFISSFSLFFLPYFSWRLMYFGHVFPNPVYCKGWSHHARFQLDVEYLKLLWPFAACALFGLKKEQNQASLFLWSPSALYLLLCIGADPLVAFFNRLFLPAFALFLPLAIAGIVALTSRMTLVYGAALVLAMTCIPTFSLAGYRQFTINPKAGEHLRMRVLEWLSLHIKPNQTVVLADSGLIPYQSSLRFTDSYCLNSEAMGHMPIQQREEMFCRQTLRDKPEVIVLTALVDAHGVNYPPVDACFAKMLHQSSSHYCEQMTFKSDTQSSSYYQYTIYRYCTERVSK
jgi:hypothetical protein